MRGYGAKSSVRSRPSSFARSAPSIRTLDSPGQLQELLLEHMNLADVESAAKTRLEALATLGTSGTAPAPEPV